MNIGDYVRFSDGELGKVTSYEYNDNVVNGHYIRINNSNIGYACEEKDFKSSPNIIDLIEEGDYVNGYRVDDIKYFYGDKKIILDEKDQRYAEFVLKGEKDIKSIVTKEQFESMEYKIGE